MWMWMSVLTACASCNTLKVNEKKKQNTQQQHDTQNEERRNETRRSECWRAEDRENEHRVHSTRLYTKIYAYCIKKIYSTFLCRPFGWLISTKRQSPYTYLRIEVLFAGLVPQHRCSLFRRLSRHSHRDFIHLLFGRLPVLQSFTHTLCVCVCLPHSRSHIHLS